MLILVFILASCEGKYSKKNDGEREILSKQTGIPISFIKILESETHAKAKHLDRNESTGEEKQVLLPGVFVGVKSKMDYYNLVKRIGARINKQGYKVFFCNGKDLKDGDRVAIVQSEDEFTPLVYMQTNGINYGLDNAQLITRIKLLNQQLDLKLLGADFDWCEFLIEKEPKDWVKLAEEIYKLCPDIVEQGTQTVAELAREMKETKRLYLWFD